MRRADAGPARPIANLSPDGRLGSARERWASARQLVGEERADPQVPRLAGRVDERARGEGRRKAGDPGGIYPVTIPERRPSTPSVATAGVPKAARGVASGHAGAGSALVEPAFAGTGAANTR